MPRYVYTCDDGDRKSVRLNAERATAGGFSEGATDDDDSAKISKSNREFGLRPRGVRLSKNDGSATDPNMKYSFLPVATATAYNSTSYSKGTQITIGSDTWEVTSKVAENAK